MIKAVRRMTDMAEAEGLKLVEVETGSRHILLVFRNAQGDLMRKPISRSPGENRQDDLNSRAQFKRFARGQYHGLLVKETA